MTLYELCFRLDSEPARSRARKAEHLERWRNMAVSNATKQCIVRTHSEILYYASCPTRSSSEAIYPYNTFTVIEEVTPYCGDIILVAPPRSTEHRTSPQHRHLRNS